MAIKEWVTVYPATQDPDPINTPGVQEDLVNESGKDVGDGDEGRVSQIHTMRDKLHEACKLLGDSSDLPVGSHGDRIATLEAGGGGGGVYPPEDTPPAVHSVYDDEFDGPLNPRWAWAFAGAPADPGESWQLKNSRLSAVLVGGDSGDNPNLAHILEQDIPSLAVDWYAVAKIRYNPRDNYNRFGLCVNYGDANNWLQYCFAFNSGRAIWFDVRVAAGWGYELGKVALDGVLTQIPATMILAIHHDSAAQLFRFYYSYDGNHWFLLTSTFDYTLWASLPTKIGLQLYPDTATVGVINVYACEWFRVLPTLP